MGIFDIFKKKPKFVDGLFGELNYTKFSDTTKNFYDGDVKFDSQKVGINIDADENGPTESQKEFYTKLLSNYASIKVDVIIPYLKKELEDWEEENQIIDFDKEFTIDGISLSSITDNSVHWSLTLYSTKINHYVTIEFIDLEPQEGIIVDG
ncbi:hypothetical protein FVB9288_01688 [Flavobacterium sp. CECT 9288]|uniref:hypothetical protein n=1 Tax=Flavobacterium sp. CECT 9288 TaxID=2845819 RepID=UPI001E48C928|nr:hypothetical protein [Flavobacterium sp. CECT 9288]CAH0336016.1 hypothetical protein FVB9288_01688 [Flavobacterium sp. CECT 9288]